MPNRPVPVYMSMKSLILLNVIVTVGPNERSDNIYIDLDIYLAHFQDRVILSAECGPLCRVLHKY